MTTFKTINNDPLIKYLNENISKTSQPLIFHENQFSYIVTNIDSESINNIFSATSQGLNYYDVLSFSTDNKVDIDVVVNYNAPEYNSVATEEKVMKSIYEVSLDSAPPMFSKNVFLNPTTDGETPSFVTNFQNNNMICVSPDFPRSSLSSYKGNFPSYVSIGFNTAAESILLGKLKEYGVYEAMIATQHLSGLATQTEPVNTDKGIREFSIQTLTDIVPEIPLNSSSWENVGSFVTDFDQRSLSVSFSPIDKVSLNAEIKQTGNDNVIKYKSLIDGLVNNATPTKSEILYYRIEKFRSGAQTPIQIFYIPATEGYDNFIDTQVMYGKSYTYKIYSVLTLYALRYKYDISILGNQTTATVGIDEAGEIRLYSFLIEEKDVLITAHAPTAPEISFFNQSSSEKKIKVYFEPNKHETRQFFIPLMESDIELQNNSVLDNDGKTIFKLSEQPLSYEIYKLNHKPKAYDDFKDSLFMSVENSSPANSEVVEFFLTPNKKFYFVFRAVNEFSLLSNPSAVFEVELVMDADETRIVSKTIDFHKIKNQRANSFGRFMKIFPAFDQVYPNLISESTNLGTNSSLSVDDYVLGNVEHSIWGRKLKIRVRSKNTGKIIDFNVDFVLNKIQSEEDFS
jgi:hypothetical protein